jgi:hypothetical protein
MNVMAEFALSLLACGVYERFQVFTAASKKFRVFWDVAPCIRVEVVRRFRGAAVRTSETSVNFNTSTRRYIPEDSKLYCQVYFIW